MADEAMSMPQDGAGESTGQPSIPGALSFLTASWVNERLVNVAEKVEAILSHIIDFGLLADGYAPFETPITDEMLTRMSPEQFRLLFDATPTLDGKAVLLARMKDLKLPLPVLLPFPEEEISGGAPRPRLAFGPMDDVLRGQS